MNIIDTSQLRECTSCQMCGAVCPTSAITISLNTDGFYRPNVDTSKCVNCGLCVKVCYKFDPDIKVTKSLSNKEIYAASATDSSVLKSTTSGGIADILAKELIKQGYKCIGVSYDNQKNCAIGTVAETEDATQSFRGSKYIQSFSMDAFRKLVSEYRNNKFAVFGLPCHIYAIDRFLQQRGCRDKHMLIDLYCHGCPTLNLWTKYVKEILAKVDGKSVISANFRSKVRGWGNFYVVVVVEGVKRPISVISPRINDPFYELFFSDSVLNDSCPECQIRSTLEYTDIRLGDFWGKSYITNHQGISGVTICSEHAKSLFKLIKPFINYTPQLFDNFLPYQSYGKKYIVNQALREKLLKELAIIEIPLRNTLDTYRRSLSPMQQVKRLLKNYIKLLPNSAISNFKHLFYLIK